MRTLGAIVLAASMLLGVAPAFAQGAQFKGEPALTRELAARLTTGKLAFELDWFLPAAGLDDLLGSWSSFGSEHSFQNGTPNALNMVIWHVTLTNFARSLAVWCDGPWIMFEDKFAASLAKLCGWPGPMGKDEAVLQTFWITLMGYAAPREEYIAWRDFFLTSSYRDKPARETIPAMALAILLNPHLLLRR
jgi:hypothetical protein